MLYYTDSLNPVRHCMYSVDICYPTQICHVLEFGSSRRCPNRLCDKMPDRCSCCIYNWHLCRILLFILEYYIYSESFVSMMKGWCI